MKYIYLSIILYAKNVVLGRMGKFEKLMGQGAWIDKGNNNFFFPKKVLKAMETLNIKFAKRVTPISPSYSNACWELSSLFLPLILLVIYTFDKQGSLMLPSRNRNALNHSL